ncbi:hypothetical protein EYC84_011489 [Monilinia fructicola]|uniref:Uncharacterized protein n=1 Tax=Monilinia fructicola TaxID=38448 RepID=A0A5M9J9M3_MONFR|nr:hypothetical protein EYC84_011489 [Monilinia fructicola]
MEDERNDAGYVNLLYSLSIVIMVAESMHTPLEPKQQSTIAAVPSAREPMRLNRRASLKIFLQDDCFYDESLNCSHILLAGRNQRLDQSSIRLKVIFRTASSQLWDLVYFPQSSRSNFLACKELRMMRRRFFLSRYCADR